jgi:hypothetical protein
MLYGIVATLTRTAPDGWTSTVNVPFFILDSNVQGIMSKDHACEIARKIVDPFDEFEPFIYATNVTDVPAEIAEISALINGDPWHTAHNSQKA